MKETDFNEPKNVKLSNENPHPEYEPPKIITYTSEQILEEIGPAQACSPSPCGAFP